MTDSIIKLFSYQNKLDLLYVDNQIRSCILTNNSPLNSKIIKLHKGVDNQVRFRVLNPDRKRVSVDHLALRVRFISTENKERVLERYADLVPSLTGELRLTVYEGDLQDIAPGYYTMVVTGEEALFPGVSEGENVNTPFYVDNGGEIVHTVEIVDSADVTPPASVTLLPENWTITTSETSGYRRYLSSAIPGSRIRNHLNAVHSFSVATTGFTGTLQIRATLDHQPPGDPNAYFPVDITSGTQIITFDDYTGITAHTFEANFMWLIFLYETENALDDDNGTLDKILVR